MAKFLNKKEQVIDFQLTDYGRYLLSIGKMKPVYYAFFDDNILYDGTYAGITGSQNSIHERIKDDTPYLEGLRQFTNIDASLLKVQDATQTDVDLYQEKIYLAGIGDVYTGKQAQFYFASDLTPTMREPKVENLKASSMIGDAALDGDQQSAPAWKIVTLQGQISASTQIDAKNEIRIPQLDIQLNYVKKVIESSITMDPKDFRQLTDRVYGFADGKMIKLEMDNLLVYAEEMNTELFTENFDVEVFKVVPNGGPWVPDYLTAASSSLDDATGSYADSFERKYFERKIPQIVDNLMITPTPRKSNFEQLTTGSVEYYFDVLTDSQIDAETACKSSEIFNKSSYYIDLDFDCDIEGGEFVVLDIYGRITESEICPT